MKNKKIVIVSLNGIGNAGGVERVNFYLYEILKEKFTVQVLQKTKISLGKFDTIIQPIIMAIRLYFIKDKIVISNSWHSSFYPADISIHHGTTSGFCRKTNIRFSLGARWIAFLEKISGKTAKQILCVSENGKKELVELYKIDVRKINVLNNFVDEGIFHVKKNVGKSKDNIILFSGRLGYRKGVASLLRLSNFIEKVDCPYDLKLRIATNDKAESAKFINNKKTEILIGLNKEQMVDFYNSGNILYFPTLYEGFSMSTLEALACGIPVIGSNYAIPDELTSFDFCKRIDNLAPEEPLCNEILQLIRSFSERKMEIHDTIIKRFGKKVYKKELLKIIENAMEN